MATEEGGATSMCGSRKGDEGRADVPVERVAYFASANKLIGMGPYPARSVPPPRLTALRVVI